MRIDERLSARRPEGIFVNPFERGEIGPDLFRAACQMGLEGLVSKRRDRPYQAGRSKKLIRGDDGADRESALASTAKEYSFFPTVCPGKGPIFPSGRRRCARCAYVELG